MNGRTGTLIDFMENDDIYFIVKNQICGAFEYVADSVLPKRVNPDLNTNSYGSKKNRMCKSSGLRIVNGRHKNGFSNDFTYCGPIGMSVLDYFIVPSFYFPNLNQLIVSNFTTYLDHAFVLVHVDLNLSNTMRNPEKCSDAMEDTERRVTYKWKDQFKKQCSECIRINIDNIMRLQNPINFENQNSFDKSLSNFTYNTCDEDLSNNTDGDYVYPELDEVITEMEILKAIRNLKLNKSHKVDGIIMNETSLQYASKGETIHIKCLFKIVNFWQKRETQFIFASCEGGLPVVNLTISNRMSVSDTCQTLTINYFTKEDVGTYQCFATIDNKQATHVINITLRTLTIDEANGSDIIERIEGEHVELTCLMNEAKTDAFIYWRVAEKVLESNRSNHVIHRFQTMQTDDKKLFVCSANKSGVDHLIEAKVQLNLILKPRVAVISTPSLPTVKKGHTITLSCQNKSGNNGVIDSFIWSHDGKCLPNTSKTIQFTRIKVEDAGKYKCIARNSAGEDSGDIVITVTFSANVENVSVDFESNDRPRTLQCKVSGVPDTYSYSKWLHYTYSNEIIRTLHGQSNGTLLLPYDNPDDLTYEDSGIYICNVTNNITDQEGNLWQTGRIHVIVKGKPVLPKPRKYSYTGHLNSSSSLDIFVLSSSNVTKASWFNEREYILDSTCPLSYAKTDHFGKHLNISAYNCKYDISVTKLKDFQNYTVEISNELGKSFFTIVLMQEQEPEKPTIIVLKSSANDIYVKFEHGYDGGYPQTFIIEYRKASAGPWTQITVDNSHTYYYIKDLESETEYTLQMYSFNKIGNSTIAEYNSIYTKLAKEKIRRTDRKDRNRNNESGSSKLNYIDVVFEPNQHIGGFYIHGADNRTPYADIDFSAKAEPLNSSDESDENSSCLENKCDDFVSLEDVQQWNITED
ncbi:Hypothetical predicted protein [Mytilus galloprovincialis]|uniref:HMCN n=1 Tax=Mytilus galloprovincialis TaxID=29158 RepID=A0A8B6CPZ2_MYTGA|nr:Hypothetical predicted protein [Mytilus galloprovincialis]